MATLASKYITINDVAQMPENKDASAIIEMLTRRAPELQDALALPANMGMKHRTTIRTGLPTITWGRMYKGIPATKGTKQSVEDTTGFMNSASEVDERMVRIYEKAEDKASIRVFEAQGHIEAMSQEAGRAIWYHDTIHNPDVPMGFGPRFNDLNAENGKQIIDAEGVGSDLTSIWLITWAPNGSHLIYPKNYKAGLDRTDRGSTPREDDNGDTFYVLREEFVWHFGLTVRNWEYVVRIANIDVEELTGNAASGPNLIDLMTFAYYTHKGRTDSFGKTFWYANTTIVMYLDLQARNISGRNLFLTFNEFGPNAKEILHFRGIPVRETDSLLNSEERVV